jgi:hypothetical protein
MTWPSQKEVVYGLFGAWRLALRDPQGMSYFNRSVTGFWHSFFAAVLVAPGYVVLVALDLVDQTLDAGWLRVLLVEAIAYVITWTAYPLVMHAITQAFDLLPRFIGYIVAYNWAKVIQMAALLPIALLGASGFLGGFGDLLVLIATIVLLLYDWYIARVSLEIPGIAAAGIVGIDLVLGVVILGIAEGMIT